MRTNVTIGSFVPENETSTMWSFRSRERKCMGTKRPGTPNPNSSVAGNPETWHHLISS